MIQFAGQSESKRGRREVGAKFVVVSGGRHISSLSTSFLQNIGDVSHVLWGEGFSPKVYFPKVYVLKV